MKTSHSIPLLTVVALALTACANPRPAGPGASEGGEATVIVSPSASELQSGCWATFFEKRGFNGDSLTLIGPIELQSLDKGSARQLKRAIDSIVTGPRATLTIYDHQLFSNRSVAFAPASREASVIERLGFGGRIESLRLECGS